MYFRYDSLLKTFVARVENIRMDEVANRWINFGQEEILNLINLLPIAEKIISRYTVKRSPKPIDIPFELCKGDVGDLITVLSVKENSYKRGKFDIYIRKCLTREDGTYTYTSEGVRFDHTLIEKFTNKVQLYQSMSETITKTTSNVMRISMATHLLRESTSLVAVSTPVKVVRLIIHLKLNIWDSVGVCQKISLLGKSSFTTIGSQLKHLLRRKMF